MKPHSSSSRVGSTHSASAVRLAIIVSALGYFVDVYDLVLFNVVRVKSLQALSLSGAEITSIGIQLLNIQLIGLLIGGLFWGVLGDKRGRVSVLMGSILLYSFANIANAFVASAGAYSVHAYALCRLLAGIGLGGEFGVGVTLVSELMPREKRGYGTMIVAVTGIFGAIVSGLVGDVLSWQLSYIVGGLLGLVLLALRIRLTESSLFSQLKSKAVSRGSLRQLLRTPRLMKKYLQCILMGAPIWIVIGLFVSLAPELSSVLKIQGTVTVGRALLFFNLGFGTGEMLSSLLSQILQSRKKVVFVFLALTAAFTAALTQLEGASSSQFYWICGLFGVGTGYWALFMMVSAEQFGTHLRATVTTSAPNLVRGLVVPCSWILASLRGSWGMISTLVLIEGVLLFLALAALVSSEETFGRDLNFVE